MLSVMFSVKLHNLPTRREFRVCGLLFALLAGWLGGLSVTQAETKFPYEATIFTDDVDVHSGPGSRFYVTASLKKGDAVTVHRHDPGGWYMIAPPSGSFSLIRSEYVRKDSGKQGTITENNVIVRVGSQANSHNEVEQRRLMKGDKVAILGEVTIADRGRNVLMLKIEPPRGEFRWVKGDYIVPKDPSLRKVKDADPYAFPSNGVEVEVEALPHNKPGNTTNPTLPVAGPGGLKPRPTPEQWNNQTGAVNAGYNPQQLERDRGILEALDRNFRDMIQQDISTWNLRDLAHDYRKLQANTPIPPIASQIDLRLQAMERYRKIKAEYDDLTRLTSSTDRRDAQLLSMQRRTELAQQSPFDQFEANSDERIAFNGPDQSGLFSSNDDALEFLPNLGPTPQGSPSAPSAMPSPALPHRPDAKFPEAAPATLAPHSGQHPSGQFPPAHTAENHPDGAPIGGMPGYGPAGPPALGQSLLGNPLGIGIPWLQPQAWGPHTQPAPGGQPQHQQQHPPRGPQQNSAHPGSGGGYSGAGVLKQVGGTARNTPPYVLVTQDDRLLAYLHPLPGVQLERFLGQSIGVTGDRRHHPQLQADVIHVTGFAPVRLTP